MKKHRKIICALITAGMLVSGLTSCGKTDVLNDYYQYNLENYVQLPEYKGLDAVGTGNILTEERIQAEILAPIYYYTKTEAVTDRGAKLGDTAVVSYVGFCEGSRISTQSQLELELGMGNMPEEFENALIGHMAGDEITVSIAYPESHEITDYAGKTVEYTVSLDAVYETKVPQYTDDFVRGYLGFDSIAEYEAAIRSNLEQYYAETNTYYIIVQLWQKISDGTAVLQYPEKELQEHYDDTLDAHKRVAEENDIAFTDYVTTYHSMTIEEFYERIMEEAKLTVKDEMICFAIARAENITLTENEYAERATEYAKEQYELDSLEAFEKEYGKEKIMRMLLCDKVQEWVASEANVVESANPAAAINRDGTGNE